MSIHWLPRVDLVRLIPLGCLLVLRYSSFKLGSPKLVTSLIPGQWNDTYLTENCSFHVCQTVCKTDFYSTNKNFKAVCKHSEIIMYLISCFSLRNEEQKYLSAVCAFPISVFLLQLHHYLDVFCSKCI